MFGCSVSLGKIRRRTTQVVADAEVTCVLPKHDIVINTAYDGKSDIVVSGDLHLQRVRRFKGIRVAGPKSILTIIRRRFGEMIVDEL